MDAFLDEDTDARPTLLHQTTGGSGTAMFSRATPVPESQQLSAACLCSRCARSGACGGYQALDWDGEQKAWLVTAYPDTWGKFREAPGPQEAYREAAVGDSRIPESTGTPNIASQQAEGKIGQREADSQVLAYTRAKAEIYASRMTAQGLPSKVVPHPVEKGKFAIEPADNDADSGVAMFNRKDDNSFHDDTDPGQADDSPDTRRAIDALKREFAIRDGVETSVQGWTTRGILGVASVAKAFGSKVVGYKVGREAGAQDPRKLGRSNGLHFLGVTYLNAETDRPHLAVLGHEIAHEMRRKRPDLYSRLVDAIRPYVDQKGYGTRFAHSPVGRGSIRDGDSREQQHDSIREEFVGEVLSDGFMDKGFWRALSAKNKQLLMQVQAFVARALEKVAATVGYTPKTAQYLTDYAKVMQIAGEVMAEYGMDQGHLNKMAGIDLKFMTAWHGGPADHDGFDSRYIGTGEGAQAYGWGHYFASRESVAKYYRDQLSKTTPAHNTIDGKRITKNLLGELQQSDDVGTRNFFNSKDGMRAAGITNISPAIDSAIESAQEVRDNYQHRLENHEANPPLASTYGPVDYRTWIAAQDRRIAGLQRLKDRIDFVPAKKNGKLYQVELAPEAGDYLLWDKPLAEQSLRVRSALETAGFDWEANSDRETGGQFYGRMAAEFGSQKEASGILLNQGIRGIKYLDGNSRSAGEGSFNYVIFDDSDIEITAKFSRAKSTEFRAPEVRDDKGRLLAPNGKPSKLNERQWHQVRSPEFKAWFGDFELASLEMSMRRVRGSDQAKAEKANIVGKPLENRETGMVATVSGESFGKMLHSSGLSVSTQAHMQALGNLDKLFPLATLTEKRAGKKANDAGRIEAIHHFVVPMPFDGDVLLVKILAKQFVDPAQGNRIYLVEAVEIETPASEKGESGSSFKGRSPHLPAGVDSRLDQMIAAVKGDGVSKVVDANGEPLVVYHGTPDGDFSDFREESYFTPSARYAQRFISPSASSIVARKSGDAPLIMPVFLNIRSPFDPRTKADRRIWDSEYFGRFGNATDLKDGLPDWTEARDLADFLRTERANDTHDGLILSEGGDPETGRRPDSFVAFRPEQIKSATGNRGTFDPKNPDITMSRGSGRGMALRDLQAVADRMSKGFKNLPNVHVLESPAALSVKDPSQKALRDFIRQSGAWNDVEGATHDGEIYLFASGMTDEARAEHVFATHEVTHYGLRGAVGKELDTALQSVWLQNAKVRKAAEQVKAERGLKSNVEAIEEVLADMPSAELAKLKGWRKVVQVIRGWLDRIGAKRLAARLDDWMKSGLSDQEKADLFVADLVTAAREWVRSGKGQAVAGTWLADSAKVGAGKAAMRDFLLGKSVASIKRGVIAAKDGEKPTEAAYRWLAEHPQLPFERQDVGEIVFDRNGLENSLQHKFGWQKLNAVAAIPDVLHKGIVIEQSRDMAGKPMLHTLIAAPIDLDGERYQMVIRLRQNQRGNNPHRFYVHEVVLEKEVAAPIKTGTEPTEWVGRTGGRSHIRSVLHGILTFKNDAPRLSRATTQSQQSETISTKDGRINTGRPLGWLLNLFDRNQIVELYGDQMPELKDYKRTQEQIVADRNQFLYKADDFLDKLRGMPASVRDRFASIAHEATVEGIDPSGEYVESGKIAEMRRVRDGLSKRELDGHTLTEKQRMYANR